MPPANPPRPPAVNPTTEHGRAGLTQDRALRTRAQILGAAAHAFADKGFPAVTVQDIAQLAGMTKGAVYFHYPNKEALARAVTDEFYQTLAHLTHDIEQQHPDPHEAITQLLTQTAQAFQNNTLIQAGARLQIERNLINTDLPTPYINFTQTITNWLTRTTHPHPQTTARVLTAAFFGAQHISWTLNNRTDITERTKEILATILPTPPTP
ncbi:TetR family transcriptional regulator [Kitasatospora indigofera]|uniref:TetR family transcriptional regulator n=1 Tax=Kitasatospora indigofera TaxID=67307 RepID=A0A919L515_9ACTN|nr:ScbR family autoregulator-binding transcription factor [Kitasatospora indigofera]GHH83739.1 TetR family transcriptional regulator [Kitasatospora indigofera]